MQLLFQAHKYGAAVKASECVENEASENRLWSLEGISYSTAVVSRQVTPHRWNKKLFLTTATLEGPLLLEGKCIPWEGSGDTFDPDLSRGSFCLLLPPCSAHVPTHFFWFASFCCAPSCSEGKLLRHRPVLFVYKVLCILRGFSCRINNNYTSAVVQRHFCMSLTVLMGLSPNPFKRFIINLRWGHQYSFR